MANQDNTGRGRILPVPQRAAPCTLFELADCPEVDTGTGLGLGLDLGSELHLELADGLEIAPGAEGVGSSYGDDVGPPPTCPQLCRHLGQAPPEEA